jgi:hypothetical protein
VDQIWEWAEERLRADMANFALVYAGSRYLPHEGKLEVPVQLFETRWRGLGGSKTKAQEVDRGKPKVKEKAGTLEGSLEGAIRMLKATLRRTQEALAEVKGGVLDVKREKQEKNAEALAVDIVCGEVRKKVKYSSKWQKMKRRILQEFHLKWKRWSLFKWEEEHSIWEKLPPPYGALKPERKHKLVVRAQDKDKSVRPGKIGKQERRQAERQALRESRSCRHFGGRQKIRRASQRRDRALNPLQK